MMRKFADLQASVGSWTDENGVEHRRRLTVGVVMRDDQSGRMSVRLELVPIAPEWSGWLSIVTNDDATQK